MDKVSSGVLIEQALRDRKAIWDTLRSADEWPIGKAALLNVVLAAFYGFVMGSYALTSHDGLKQALASAVKVPCLFLLTLLICLPSLYVVSALLGSSLSVRQLIGILMASFLVTTVLLAAFAPITAFFMLSARDYGFITLLNVIFFAIATGAGVGVIAHAVKTIGSQEQGTYVALLRFWFLTYAFVGTQMAWILRPFIGSPDVPFSFFRDMQGNFYSTVVRIIGHLF